MPVRSSREASYQFSSTSLRRIRMSPCSEMDHGDKETGTVFESKHSFPSVLTLILKVNICGSMASCYGYLAERQFFLRLPSKVKLCLSHLNERMVLGSTCIGLQQLISSQNLWERGK